MNIYLNFEHPDKELHSIELHKLTQFVLEHEGFNADSNVSVSITFVENDEITRLNSQFRGINAPTDVLSFEFGDGEDFGNDDEFDFCQSDGTLTSELADTMNDSTPQEPQTPQPIPHELGDVIIAPDVARAQCSGFNTTFEGEISLLLVHGLLHLCGYDHIEDADAKVMQSRESAILGEWQKTHPNVCPPDYEMNTEIVTGAH